MLYSGSTVLESPLMFYQGLMAPAAAAAADAGCCRGISDGCAARVPLLIIIVGVVVAYPLRKIRMNAYYACVLSIVEPYFLDLE